MSNDAKHCVDTEKSLSVLNNNKGTCGGKVGHSANHLANSISYIVYGRHFVIIMMIMAIAKPGR